MAHVRKQIDRDILATLSQIAQLRNAGRKEFVQLVDRLRQQVVLAIVEAGSLDATTVVELRNQLPMIMETYQTKMLDQMTEDQRRVFVKGIQIVDRAAKSAGEASVSLPHISEERLKTLREYNADLITGLTDDARKRILTEVSLAAMGQKSQQEVIDAIGRKLTSPSIFGTIAKRAKTIYITELHRVQNHATNERLAQLKKSGQVEDMRKRWLHSHFGAPRWTHLDLDRKVIDADEKFTLKSSKMPGISYEVVGPHDPTLPAEEVVNCRCTLVPVVGRFQKWGQTPANDPIRRDRIGAEPPEGFRHASDKRNYIAVEDYQTYKQFMDSLGREDALQITRARNEVRHWHATHTKPDGTPATGGTKDFYPKGTDRKYIDKRIQAYHETAQAKAFLKKDGTPITPVPEGVQPTIFFTGGKPGSGKSSAYKDRDVSNFVVIDSDEFKKLHPDWKPAAGLKEGWNASIVQEEVDEIVEATVKEALEKGYNVIFDSTMKTAKAPTKWSRIAKEFGYRVEGIFVDAPTGLTMSNALSRFKKSGRFVDPAYISVHGERNEATFKRLVDSGIFDAWEKWENRPDLKAARFLTKSKESLTIPYKSGQAPADQAARLAQEELRRKAALEAEREAARRAAEQAAAEKAAAEKAAAEKAAAEKAAAEKAAAEKAAAEKAAAEKAAAEAERKRIAREKAKARREAKAGKAKVSEAYTEIKKTGYSRYTRNDIVVDRAAAAKHEKTYLDIQEALTAIDSVHSDGKLPKIPLLAMYDPSAGYKGGFRMQSIGAGMKPKDVEVNAYYATEPMITTAHETGHFLDRSALSSADFKHGTDNPDGEMAKVIDTILKTKAVGRLSELEDMPSYSTMTLSDGRVVQVDHAYCKYALRPRELWARAYAQYIAIRSGNPKMREQLDQLRKTPADDYSGYATQWSDEEFEAIAKEIDELFKQKGWLITKG